MELAKVTSSLEEKERENGWLIEAKNKQDMELEEGRDTIRALEKKIKSSFSGGQSTVEELRKKGWNADIDVAYQYLRYFFEENDNELEKIREEYVSGKLLTGEIKSICVEKAESWMKEHHDLKEQNQHLIKDFLS